MADKIRVTYNGHSCFTIEYAGHSLVMDPYLSVPGYQNLYIEAGEVYASHTQHDDHGYFDAVKIVDQPGESPFKVTTIPCFHDTEGGKKRGKNNITIIEAAGKRIVHMGDIGHDLIPDKIKKLHGADLLLIPIGGFFTIDSKLAHSLMERIDPVITVPMHYRTGKYGFDIIAEPETFTELVTDRPVILSEVNELELDDDATHRVVLLKYLEREY